jgi:hypothetical protein
MDQRRTRVERVLDWIMWTAMPAYFRRVMRLPKPLGITVVVLSGLAIFVVFLAVVAFAAFGPIFGYRAR